MPASDGRESNCRLLKRDDIVMLLVSGTQSRYQFGRQIEHGAPTSVSDVAFYDIVPITGSAAVITGAYAHLVASAGI